jgi:4-hydroxythreonine-4-phosphate dehydrogenase
MGDPRGIGPEVALRALAGWRPLAAGRTRVRLVGVRGVFERAARLPRMQAVLQSLADEIVDVRDAAAGEPDGSGERRASPGRRAGAASPPPHGVLAPEIAGAWAGRSIEAAVRGLDPARGDVLVTAPIEKLALALAGWSFPGHTEMLAALSGAPRVAMMLVAGGLRVTLVTGHLPLREVPDRATRERIRDAFELTEEALRVGFGVVRPRIGICGLNPHAGEGGVLGDEEDRVVEPEVVSLRARGYDVAGPLPADTAFVRAAAGEFDAVLALYHDQGMIPVKLHGFGRGVNVTLGLPFVRTSPDHGTAFDLAGTGRASPASFREALDLARALADRRAGTAQPVVAAGDPV